MKVLMQYLSIHKIRWPAKKMFHNLRYFFEKTCLPIYGSQNIDDQWSSLATLWDNLLWLLVVSPTPVTSLQIEGLNQPQYQLTKSNLTCHIWQSNCHEYVKIGPNIEYLLPLSVYIVQLQKTNCFKRTISNRKLNISTHQPFTKTVIWLHNSNLTSLI